MTRPEGRAPGTLPACFKAAAINLEIFTTPWTWWRGPEGKTFSRHHFAPKEAGSGLTGGLDFDVMNFDNPIIVIVPAAIVLSIVIGGLFSYFSPESKAERRRRRSNSPVVSKSHRPTVKLSSRTKRSKD
jgi:hypothetical protein